MKKSMLVCITGGALLAGSLGTAFAANITMIQPSAANVALDGGKVTVRFNVSGTAVSQDHCGYVVEYGDGAAPDTRIIENENGPFNRAFERTFTRPGTYTVSAVGKRVKTTSGCNGSTSATITVVASRSERRAQRTAAEFACPEAWVLNEKSVNRSTGAYSCTPKPAVEIACAEGLRYFERDGVIGCRSGRRNQ